MLEIVMDPSMTPYLCEMQSVMGYHDVNVEIHTSDADDIKLWRLVTSRYVHLPMMERTVNSQGNWVYRFTLSMPKDRNGVGRFVPFYRDNKSESYEQQLDCISIRNLIEGMGINIDYVLRQIDILEVLISDLGKMTDEQLTNLFGSYSPVANASWNISVDLSSMPNLTARIHHYYNFYTDGDSKSNRSYMTVAVMGGDKRFVINEVLMKPWFDQIFRIVTHSSNLQAIHHRLKSQANHLESLDRMLKQDSSCIKPNGTN